MLARLPIVPEGTNKPASLPIISAAISCNRLTVGSSPYTSSPTSAFAIASRISGVGFVTVSERRSTNSISTFLSQSVEDARQFIRKRSLERARLFFAGQSNFQFIGMEKVSSQRNGRFLPAIEIGRASCRERV